MSGLIKEDDDDYFSVYKDGISYDEFSLIDYEAKDKLLFAAQCLVPIIEVALLVYFFYTGGEMPLIIIWIYLVAKVV